MQTKWGSPQRGPGALTRRGAQAERAGGRLGGPRADKARSHFCRLPSLLVPEFNVPGSLAVPILASGGRWLSTRSSLRMAQPEEARGRLKVEFSVWPTGLDTVLTGSDVPSASPAICRRTTARLSGGLPAPPAAAEAAWETSRDRVTRAELEPSLFSGWPPTGLQTAPTLFIIFIMALIKTPSPVLHLGCPYLRTKF